MSLLLFWSAQESQAIDPADATIRIGGQLLLSGQLPTPLRRDGEVIPGTVNILTNPDFESGVVQTDGWVGDGVTLAWDTGVKFDGNASLEVTIPDGAGDRTVLGVCSSGLMITGVPQVWIGSVWVLGAFEGLTVTLRAQYTDASIASGDVAEIDFADPDEWTRPICSIILDPDKILDTLFLVVERTTGTTGGTIHLDEAQVELDAGWGATPTASGRFGLPYHYWVGQDHRSASVRDDIPVEIKTEGRFGEYRLHWRMYRANAAFQLLEDVSEHVISASVTGDRERQPAWTLNCRMDRAGWNKLTAWEDWLVPVLFRTDDRGEVRSGFLGHYCVLPSPSTHWEHHAEYDVDARSGEYLLSRQAFKGKIIVGKGAILAQVARWVVETTSEFTSGIRPRIQMQVPGHRAEERYEFTREQSKLEIVNTLLEAAVMQPLWTSRTGIYRSFRTDTDRYKTMQPVKLFAENFDPGTAGTERFIRQLARQMPAESRVISGPIKRIPNLGDAENEIVVYTVDPRRPRVGDKYRIDDPTNPTSIFWKGRWKSKKFPYRMVGTSASARQIARAIAQEIGTKIEQVEFRCIPDPEPDLLDNIVYLALYKLDGTPAATGRYRVLKVNYQFSAQNALMDLTLGFVHGVAEFRDSHPIRFYDARNQTWSEDVGQPIFLEITA